MGGKIHVGDVGTAFIATVEDEQGEVVDVSGVATLLMWFEMPDGTTFERTAELEGDGTDGRIQYVTVAGDLDVPDNWKVQGVVTTPSGGPWHSDVHRFRVWPNLRADG